MSLRQCLGEEGKGIPAVAIGLHNNRGTVSLDNCYMNTVIDVMTDLSNRTGAGTRVPSHRRSGGSGIVTETYLEKIKSSM